jgi:hypothetical protein
MRKRSKYLIGALTLLAAVGISATAIGARTVSQSTVADLCKPKNAACKSPARLPKRKFKPAKLHVVLAAKDAADPDACRTTPDTNIANPRGCRVPPSSDNVKVDFDNDIKFSPNAIGKCNPATIAGDGTVTARNQCGPGFLGGGSGFGRFGAVGTPGGGDVPVTLSAFNSTNANQIIFHVDPGFAPFDLTGTLVPFPQGDFAKRLDTAVASANVLVRFDITIGKGGFVKARCKDQNRKFNFRYLFHYGDPGTAPNNYPTGTLTTSADKCKRL